MHNLQVILENVSIAAISLPTEHQSNQSMVFILAALLLGIYANAIRVIHSDNK